MDENPIERPLTRNRGLATGLAVGVTLLVGCGSGAQRAPGWTFVVDRKHTARLSRRPARIVAYTTAAVALHDCGVKPVGVFCEIHRRTQRSLVSRGRTWNSLVRSMARSTAGRCAKSISAFAELPAVRANQIGVWQADTPPLYQTYPRKMNDLAKAVANWREVI